MRRAVVKRYLAPVFMIAVLYLLNRLLLIPATAGPLHRFLSWYFADLLSGGLMLCILNIALGAANRPAVTAPLPAGIFLLGCGLFWELVTPLYLARSVSDPRDVLACWTGGMGMLLLLRKRSTRQI